MLDFPSSREEHCDYFPLISVEPQLPKGVLASLYEVLYHQLPVAYAGDDIAECDTGRSGLSALNHNMYRFPKEVHSRIFL